MKKLTQHDEPEGHEYSCGIGKNGNLGMEWEVIERSGFRKGRCYGDKVSSNIT